jgi:hypothetical protein
MMRTQLNIRFHVLSVLVLMAAALGFQEVLASNAETESARTGIGAEPVDIALFAKVVTSDPARKHGSLAGRLEEFPAEDVFLTWEVSRNRDNAYTLPVSSSKEACIGLQWAERRLLTDLSLTFASQSDIPDPSQAFVEYWSSAGREDSWAGIGQARLQLRRVMMVNASDHEVMRKVAECVADRLRAAPMVDTVDAFHIADGDAWLNQGERLYDFYLMLDNG